jgi:hypothetical protein
MRRLCHWFGAGLQAASVDSLATLINVSLVDWGHRLSS